MRVPFKFASWDALYQGQPESEMPWFYDGLDPDFAQALEEYRLTSGQLLDLGCGAGTQAIALVRRGFQVTATDISPTAVQNAGQLAEQQGVPVTFVRDNILSSAITAQFDIVFDRGVFHLFDPEERPQYCRQLSAWLTSGHYFFLKCFAPDEPGTDGPFRLPPETVISVFEAAFQPLSHRPTIYYGTRQPPPRAIFYVFQKR